MNNMTARQIMVAVNYCLFGCDANSGENPILPPDEEKDKEKSLDNPELSTTIGVIHEAQSLRLGISLNDMRNMTPSEL